MTEGPSSSTAPSSEEWTIAAAMLQFSASTKRGEPIETASAGEWQSTLAVLRYEGFSDVELSSRWLDLTKLSSRRLADLCSVCSGLGLGVPGYLVAGATVLDGEDGTVDYIFRSLEAAAGVGARTVCVGLHRAPARAAGGPEWFWNSSSPPSPPSANGEGRSRGEVVGLFHRFAARAQDLGLQLSLEMYPGTYVGTAASAVELVRDVDHPAFGLNPDLGNLVRAQGQIEDWEEVARLTLPFANYWHVKNYMRCEIPQLGAIITHPTSLELGVINYRTIIEYAVAAGFVGTIVTEHYGGDGLGISASNRDYLRGLIRLALRGPLCAEHHEGNVS